MALALADDRDALQHQYEEAHKEWAAQARGAILFEQMIYQCQCWEDAGLDVKAIFNEVPNAPEMARALLAMTPRPSVEIRKPRQGKSKWTEGSQARLVVDVYILRNRSSGVLTKMSVASACMNLTKRSGSEWYARHHGAAKSLERRYREALKSPTGRIFEALLWLREQSGTNAPPEWMDEALERIVALAAKRP